MVHGLHPNTPWRDRRFLEHLYVDERLTQKQIGNIFGKRKQTISKWLRRVDIETRGGYTNPQSNGPWTKKAILEDRYIDQGQTQAEIADEFDQSPRTIRRWLERHDIPTRNPGPVPGGDGHSSLYYGPNWPQHRSRIIERDDCECACCRTARVRVVPDLNVHHITPARAFIPGTGDPEYAKMNDDSNLITLCPSCHARFEGRWQECSPTEFAKRARLERDHPSQINGYCLQ